MKDCQLISAGGGLLKLGHGGVLFFCCHFHCVCYKLYLMVSDLVHMYQKIMNEYERLSMISTGGGLSR